MIHCYFLIPSRATIFYKRLLLWTVVLTHSLAAYAQEEVAVDRFTGTAQLTIPLYTVRSHNVTLPLTLLYHASGVKVEDSGNMNGVNWSLNGLPVIERQVRDLPDDLFSENGQSGNRYGWLASGKNVPAKAAAVGPAASTTNCSGAESDALSAIAYTISVKHSFDAGYDVYDSEPDIFSYSIPGHHGKFIFDNNQNVKLIPNDNVFINVIRGATSAISSFELYSPEGHKYIFDVQDIVSESSTPQATAPSFYNRQYLNYLLPDASNNPLQISYCSAWHASAIYMPQLAGGSGNSSLGQAIWFTYNPLNDAGGQQTPKQLTWSGSATSQTLYTTGSNVTRQQLVQINTNILEIDLTYDNSTSLLGGPLLSMTSYGAMNGQKTLDRRINFDYTQVSPNYYLDRPYYDSYGTAISNNRFNFRSFLTSIRTGNDCSIFSVYSFDYQSPSSLPPLGCVEQDYWGYYNGNRAATPVPQLYVYPQLDPATTPGGPYRLFEAPNLSGEITLPGADRRPAQALADFQQTTLAGTLTGVTLPTGGRISLEYEPHRFYDPVAQSYFNGAGVRVKAVHVKDNISGVEQVRQYQYLQTAGESSGRLLHVPRLAIATPVTGNQGGTLQSQWISATITSLDDLAPDPFEYRSIGYGRVVEQVAGRGQSIYTYSLAALPEDNLPAGYQRTQIGLARQTIYVNGTQQCPTTGLYQPGFDVYPFPQATNYEQERGNLLTVTHQTEPNSRGFSQTVQSTAYQYGYVTQPISGQVHGVSYEQVSPGLSSPYVYANYMLQTGFVFKLLNEATTTYDQFRTSQGFTNTTRYVYNNQGQLLSDIKQNSDGSYVRRRLKYLADFTSSATPAGPFLAAVNQRYNSEKINGDVVETITELKPAGSKVAQVNSVVVNTFVIDDGCTRPAQQFTWRPAQAVITNNSVYDSTRIKQSSNYEIVVNPQAQLRPALTVETVSQQLVPTDTYKPSGRQRQAQLMTPDGYSSKLQVQNAKLSEILFSDFESITTKDFTFQGFSTATYPGYPASSPHTGLSALALPSGTAIYHSLPESTHGSYRLSFWAQNEGTSAAFSILLDGSTIATQPAKAGSQWQLIEIPLSFATVSAPRASHTLQIIPSGQVFLDDILLIPAAATATSTTFDNLYRRTSQIDGNNQTIYFTYDPSGQEAVVLNHNKNVVKVATKVVAGNGPNYKVDFTTVGDLFDQVPIEFDATGGCLPNAQYSWKIVDAQSRQLVVSTAASSSSTTSQTINSNGQTKSYEVTLTVTSLGQHLTQTRTITVSPGPWLVQLSSCGATFYDACTGAYTYESCGGGPSTNQNVVFDATISNYVNCGALSYSWEITYGNSTNSGPWQAINNNSPQLIQPSGANSYRVRCTVLGCNRTGISSEAGYTVNYRDSNGQLCTGVPSGAIMNTSAAKSNASAK